MRMIIIGNELLYPNHKILRQQSHKAEKILNNIPIDKKMLSSKSLSILDPRSDYKWDKFSTKCYLTESMDRHDEVYCFCCFSNDFAVQS